VNRAPVAANDKYGLTKNSSLTVSGPGVLANDTDLDGDTLTAILVTGPVHGTLSLNPDGGFTYTPVSNYFGADGFTYQANDGLTNSAAATVSVTITNVNRAPVAVNDAYGLGKNTSLTVNGPGVLVNDTDLDGDTLTAILVTGPTHGALSLNANGGFTYTPVSNYFGADSFTYQASDGLTNSGTATVSLAVANVNRPPVAANDSYGLNKNSSLTIVGPGVLANDTDPDGDSLTANLVSGPAHGSLSLNPNGGFTYTPGSNYFGADNFTYQANDGLTSSVTATVSLTISNVNRAPVAANDSYGLNKNSSLTVSGPGVLANDTDLDGDTLTAILVTGPAHGALSLNTNGGFTYTPVSNYFGADSFSYLASDGLTNSGTAIVSLTISNVNRAPVAVDDSYGLNKNASLTVSGPGVLVNDTDLDGDTLTANLVTGPGHGALSFNPNGGFTYTPVSNYFGADSFTYQANDGLTNSATATVSLTIFNVNRAPVAANDSYGLNKNSSLTVIGPGILANDTDLDGDALTAILITGPAHGALTLNTNGGFTFTPVSNYFGADSFTYRASDGLTNSGTATVSLTISNVNRAPVAANDSYGLNKNSSLTVTGPGVLANDTDLDGDALTANLIAGPAHGSLSLNPNGGFTYTPVSNYFGADSFTYQANDGVTNSATATVSLTITNVNRVPVAANDTYGLNKNSSLTVTGPGVLSNDTDLDGDSLTATRVSGPAHGSLTLNANGGFTYTPASNYFGADSFTYQANDGLTNSATATVSLTITNLNRAPVAANDSYGLNKNGSLVVSGPGVLSNDTDLDGDSLTATLASGPAHGTLTLTANGGFTYTPVSNYFGADAFTYQANDGQTNSGAATVTLTITNVNHAPVAVNDSYGLYKNGWLVVSGPGVLSNDTDLDGDTFTATLVSGPAHGTLSLNANGGFSYTPVSNYFGADNFTYRANDGLTNSGTATVSLTITNGNSNPVAVSDTLTNLQNVPRIVPFTFLLTNDYDPDGDPITVLLVATNSSQGGKITFTATNLLYTPPTNFVGTDTFTYVISDGQGGTGTGTVSVVIVPVQFGILAGTIVLNPQTGLYEQQVTVTNTGTATVPGVRLLVGGLRSGVSLYNAVGTNGGRPYVQYNAPLNPAQTVQLMLEFYVPDRHSFTNTLEAQAVMPVTTGVNGAAGVPIDKFFTDTRIAGSPRFVIEFVSIPGRVYTIIYSDDLMATWQAATPSITANATRTQWYDDGPPKTVSKPLSNTSRLYRVLVAPVNP
jgi:VCBS repeat-containing protein